MTKAEKKFKCALTVSYFRTSTVTSPRGFGLTHAGESPQSFSRFPRAVSGRRTFHAGQVIDRRQVAAPGAGIAGTDLTSPSNVQQDPQTGRLTFLDKLTSKFSKRLVDYCGNIFVLHVYKSLQKC